MPYVAVGFYPCDFPTAVERRKLLTRKVPNYLCCPAGADAPGCNIRSDASDIFAEADFTAELLTLVRVPLHFDSVCDIFRDENPSVAEIHHAFVSDNGIRLLS